jgi:outer membrane protein
MNYGFYILIYFISWFFLITEIQAQDLWGLERCVKTAIENNLNLKNAELNINQTIVNRKQAAFSRLPSLNAGTGMNWNFGRSIDPTTNEFIAETFVSNTFNLNTGMVLFDGFRIKNTIVQSKLDEKAARFDVDQFVRDLSLNVASAYLNVLFATENMRISENLLQLSMEQKAVTESFIKRGTRPENELFDVEAQVARDEQQVVSDRNNYNLSMLALKQLMLIDPEIEIILIMPENIELITDPDMISLAELYRSALNTQENIKAAETRVLSADYGKKIARAGFMPTLGIGGAVGTNYSNRFFTIDGFTLQRTEQNVFINGNQVTLGIDQPIPNFVDKPYFNQMKDNLFVGFGFNLSVPIFNNYANSANFQRAKLNLEFAQNNLDIEKINLKTNITQAHADAKAGKSNLNAADKARFAQRAAWDNAMKRFEAGVINNFELSQVKARLDNAEVSYLIAKYDYIFRIKVLDFYMGKPIKFSN